MRKVRSAHNCSCHATATPTVFLSRPIHSNHLKSKAQSDWDIFGQHLLTKIHDFEETISVLLPTILHCCLSLRSLFRRDRKRFLHKFGGFPFKFKYLIREQPLWRENWFFLLWISQKGSHTEVKIRKLRPFLSELDSLLILFWYYYQAKRVNIAKLLSDQNVFQTRLKVSANSVIVAKSVNCYKTTFFQIASQQCCLEGESGRWAVIWKSG